MFSFLTVKKILSLLPTTNIALETVDSRKLDDTGSFWDGLFSEAILVLGTAFTSCSC